MYLKVACRDVDETASITNFEKIVYSLSLGMGFSTFNLHYKAAHT